jgi:hypothetical protein
MGSTKFYHYVMVVAFNATRDQLGILVSSYSKRGLGSNYSDVFQNGEHCTKI